MSAARKVNATSAGPSSTSEFIAEALRIAETDPRRSVQLIDRFDAQGPAGPQDLGLQGLAAWARGRAERQLGHRRQAGDALRAAVDLLTRSGDPEAASRAAVSLALERIDAGQFDEAIRLLDAAADHLSGGDVARMLIQKGLALQRSGRVVDALGCWNEAIAVCAATGMVVDQGVAWQNRGIVHVYRGDFDAAERDLEAALETFSSCGQEIRAMEVLHNLGFVASRRGDLPRALELFDRAQAEAARLGTLRPQALVDRVEATLDAGLIGEGRALAEAAVALLEKSGFEADVPEACLVAARACELDGRLDAAAEWARLAVERFDGQQRPRWRLLARLAELTADVERSPLTDGAADALLSLSVELSSAGWFGPAIEAQVRAARNLIELGVPARAEAIVEGLSSPRHRPGPLSRLDIRLVQARLCLETADHRGARRALLSALGALRAFQSTLGSIELRSHGAGRSNELMELGVTLAGRSGRAEEGLWWTEAVRGTIHSGGARPVRDPEMLRLLESLRDATALLGAESVTLSEASRLRRRQSALEELIRRRSRHTPSGDQRPARLLDPARRLDPGELVAAFEDTTLVDYVLAGERLQAVVVQRSRCRLVDLGPLADVRRTTAGVRMALGTAVSAKPEAKRVGPLVEAAAAAEKALLRPLDLEDTDRMVIVTDGPLGSLPWGVLPGLAQVDVTVARSVTAWIEARAGEPSQRSDPRVLVVAGPSLQYAEQEAEEISRIWPRVTTLAGSDATIGNFLDALAEADVVHVAAHGTHRGDNPLLSAIRLADGSLTGYELSNAEKQVDTVVLSCCEVGMTETGSGIGIAQVLVQTGVRSVIASVSPVSDESAVSLTSDLHRRLARQIRPATALRQSRNTMGGPFEYPTGAGLICFGAG